MPLRVLFLMSMLSVLALPVQAQTRTYCCNDSSGRRTCSDSLPQVCFDRAYVELVGGRVVREVEAPLTPEQRVKRDLELRAKREKLAKEAEARRRDQVLLDSYATVGELDRRRDRDIGNLEGEIRAARAREADLLAQGAKLEKQVPAKGAIPRLLSENLAVNASELAAIRQVISSKLREVEQLKTLFEADRKRYLELNDPTPAARN